MNKLLPPLLALALVAPASAQITGKAVATAPGDAAGTITSHTTLTFDGTLDLTDATVTFGDDAISEAAVSGLTEALAGKLDLDGDGSALTDLTFGQLGSTPTTLSGYGITDAASADLTNAAAAAALALASDPLSGWKALPHGTGAIALCGDSTTYNNATGVYAKYQTPFGPLYGVTITEHASAGDTVASWVAGGRRAAAIAANADVYIVSFGINMAKPPTNMTAAQIRDAIKLDVIDSIKASVPRASFVLRMPNMITKGGVFSDADAQRMTDDMRSAYEQLEGVYPYVTVYRTIPIIYSATSAASPSADSLHQDETHPNGPGNNAIVDDIVAKLDRRKPAAQNYYVGGQANAVDKVSPWTYYKEAFDDPRYFQLILTGSASTWSTSNAWFRFGVDKKLGAFDGGAGGAGAVVIRRGDVIYPEGYTPFRVTGTAGGQTFDYTVGVIDQAPPETVPAGTKIKVYRQAEFGDTTIEQALRAGYKYIIQGVVSSGGTNYIDLSPDPRDAIRAGAIIKSSDKLLIEGYGSQISLSAVTFPNWQSPSPGSGYMRFNLTGSWSSYVGKNFYVIGSTERSYVRSVGVPDQVQDGARWIDSSNKPRVRANAVSLYEVTSTTDASALSGILKANGSGTLSEAVSGTDYVIPSGSITGNAATATALATPRTINGTSFDGTANITVTAAADTLTGTTLASGITASSLTSAAGGSFGTAAYTAATAYTSAPVSPPATASSTGTAGTWSYDTNYIYICVATDTWLRAAIVTW